MPRLLTPKFLVRGFEFSVLASLVGFGIILVYGNDFSAFLAGVGRLHWIWLLVGVGLASMDWIGGGLRNWVVARHVYPRPPLKGMILAGGMGAWGGYITPLNSGAGPMTIYTMRRYGLPLPVAVTSTFMSFVATILFFAIAGPLALLFGAGQSLGQRGNVLGLSLYDLFRGSLTIDELARAACLSPRQFTRLFRAETGSGAHVGPSGRYDRLRYEAEIYAFLLERLQRS